MSKYGIQVRGTSPILRNGQGFTPGHKPQLSTYDKGGRVGLKKGGDTRTKKFGGGRANLLEEVGRIDAEKMNPNRRAEKHRVIGELNRGYNKGGRVELSSGTKKETRKEKKKRKRKELSQQVSRETFHEAVRDLRSTKGKVHSIKRGQEDSAERIAKLHRKQEGYFFPEKTLKKNFGKVRDKGWGGKHSTKVEHNATGGRVGLKKGGDDKWIQKATASIKKRGTEGKCTPITKKGCTGRAKALAKTFKKMANKRKS